MVHRYVLDLEKLRVPKWKRRADERRFCDNRHYKDACAREDQLDSSRHRYKNLVCHTHKLIQAYHHLSNVAFEVRVREMNRLKSSSDSLIRSRHSVFMENQRLRAEIVGLRGHAGASIIALLNPTIMQVHISASPIDLFLM
nr:hypothetical protein [Tanacetum cinerariifolium]